MQKISARETFLANIDCKALVRTPAFICIRASSHHAPEFVPIVRIELTFVEKETLANIPKIWCDSQTTQLFKEFAVLDQF